jgi:hypothetical protein
LSRKNSQRSFVYWFVIVTGLVFFSSALICLLALGWHMRLSGDDYCYNAVLAQKGFWGMQTYSYNKVSMYNGNRYSANLLAGFFGLFPIRGSFLLITASLLAWLGGIVVLLQWFSRRFELKLSWIEAFVIAEAFASILLWGAPSLNQSLFWRSGLLSYFSPVVGGTWVLANVCFAGTRSKGRWLHLLLIFLAAIIVGGFSETGASFWGGFWAVSLLSLLMVRWSWKKARVGPFALPISAAFLGTILAVSLLALSPSTALKLSENPSTLDFGRLVPHLVLNVRVYLWINLMRRGLMVLVPFLFGLGLGSGLSLRQQRMNKQPGPPGNIWMLSGALLLIGVAVVLLITAVMLPVTLIQADYPPDRALILGQAVLTVASMAVGYLVARLFYRFIQGARLHSARTAFCQKLLWVVTVFLMFTSLVAPVQIFQIGVENGSLFHRWSQLWDQRHAKLVAAGREGVESIRVMALDHLIEDVGELAADPGYWYNNCAEMVYGVDEIIADQPGW